MDKSKKKKTEPIFSRMSDVDKIRFRLQNGWMYGSQKRLLDFAESRNISTSEIFWQERALITAALEHPELDPDKPKRGRPEKPKPSLMGPNFRGPEISNPERAKFWAIIQHYRETYFKEHSKKLTDRKAAQKYALEYDKYDDEKTYIEKEDYHSNVKKYQRWIKECKTELLIR